MTNKMIALTVALSASVLLGLSIINNDVTAVEKYLQPRIEGSTECLTIRMTPMLTTLISADDSIDEIADYIMAETKQNQDLSWYQLQVAEIGLRNVLEECKG